MAVNGDLWHSINLAQLCPELDPNNPGSFASLARDKLNQVEGDTQSTLSAVNNSLNKVVDLINHVNTASQSVKSAQRTLEEFVNNAANTGIYTKFLGICPIDGKNGFPPSQMLKGSNDVYNAVAKAMNTGQSGQLPEIQAAIGREKRAAQKSKTAEERTIHLNNVQTLKKQFAATQKNQDPCQPVFTGSTAFVGGFLLLVGAPNPQQLFERLKAFAILFPVLKDVISDGTKNVMAIGDSLKDLKDLFANVGSLYDQYKKEFADFKKLNPAINTKKLIQGIPTSGCPDKWICSKLKDIVPALDPYAEGSPLNLAMNFEQELVDDVTAVMDRVGAMTSTAFKLIGAVGLLQNMIRELKDSILDQAEKLAATGVYFHAIGRDLTVTNNDMFISAVGAALNDMNDPQKPNFRGDTALMAGVLFVIGAPNPRGLEDQFQSVGAVFKGFSGKYKSFTASLDDIKKNANNLYTDMTTLSGADGSVIRSPTERTVSMIDGKPVSTFPIIGSVPTFTKDTTSDTITKTVTPVEFAVTNPTTSTLTVDGSGTAPGEVTPIAGEAPVNTAALTSEITDPTCEPSKVLRQSEQKVIVEASGGGEQIREARRRIADLNKI